MSKLYYGPAVDVVAERPAILRSSFPDGFAARPAPVGRRAAFRSCTEPIRAAEAHGAAGGAGAGARGVAALGSLGAFAGFVFGAGLPLDSEYPHRPHERRSPCSARKTPGPHFGHDLCVRVSASPWTA